MGSCGFHTEDGGWHEIDGRWDLVIAHPPCTYLSNAGACRLYKEKGVLDLDRYVLGLKGKEFFMRFWYYGYYGYGKIVIENPVPSKVFDLPKHTNCIQPYEYGDGYSKKTYLWEFGVTPLMPKYMGDKFIPYVSCGTSKNKGNSEKAGVSRSGGASRVRSKTFTGIAEAMAEQWG